ncbi:MAG: zinc ribbon domain-containing protein [Acidobacteriaceae bacterium]|nr:zinc ribbon domain-containing protein [Acidobacteriaceae bacterium]MBV9781867.1 zinc ribbon domain-containing protein [Acidobacteriaceae bacterium]
MQPRCTCGAVLPDDARFCHKCGKPQYEEDIARLTPEPVPVARTPVPLPEPRRISFSNSRAVGITLAVAACTLFGIGIATLVSPFLAPIVLCAAGAIAAKLYKGRSVEPLSPAGGARLGWMTGLWLFAVVVICLAFFSVAITSPSGRELLKSIPTNAEVAKMLANPHEFLADLPVGMIQTFLFVTLLPGLGGMLGAKLGTGSRQSS